MKTSLRTAIVGAVIAVLISSTTNAQMPTGSVSFRAESGDTYISLFGPDWQKAYRQNKVTVIRKGHPVSSPDILVEDSIVTVSGDVKLTQRGWSRVQVLQQRRAQLQARLAALKPNLPDDQGARKAATDCQHLLESAPRFAAEVDFAGQEIAHLERLSCNKPASRPVQTRAPVEWVVTLGSVILALTCAVFWRRQRPVYTAGRARYREALKDVETAFQSAGVHH